MSRREWFLVVGVSAVIVVAFGSILYGFSVFVTDRAAGAEFSTSVLSLGLTGAGIMSGLLAVPLGRFMDRRGVRGVLLAGAAFGGLGMVAFSMAHEPWQVVAVWWFLLGQLRPCCITSRRSLRSVFGSRSVTRPGRSEC